MTEPDERPEKPPDYQIIPDPLSDESLDNVGVCELNDDCPMCGHLACARCPACLNGWPLA